jgi:hypothetical protein
MSDPCYELIADHIDPEEWRSFRDRLQYGFKALPSDWDLDPALRERLMLRIQWHFFNPDLTETITDKRSRSWAFMTSFLGDEFKRKFAFLRNRLEEKQRDKWDKNFADFETLLLLSAMTDPMRLDWLSNFDARVKYGEAKRVKVLKGNQGLGLQSELLGVNVLMSWEEIKTRFRFMLKKVHPDVGGSVEQAREVIVEFERLKTKSGLK